MKNVLQVMPEFGLAGAETMCESLCYQLQKSGRYNVIVASLFDFHSPITERMEKRGIRIIYLNKKSGIDIPIIYKLYKVMKEYHVDIVHTHRYVMQYAIPAAIMAGVKVRIHTVHNIATKEVDGYRRTLAHFFFKHCNVVPVSISPLIQQSVMKEYNITQKQTPVIYNGSDLSKCLVKSSYSASEPFNILHIGRFNPQKNHSVIIDAAQRLKEDGLKFVIKLIGGAGDEEKYKQEVIRKGLDDEVVFCGLQGNVYPFLQAADCFILPSLYEGMPITLVEAMGGGLPIIASAVGGVPDMIENGRSGILISPNADQLVLALKKLMADEKLREFLGENAFVKSKEFSTERMFNGYDNLYISKWQ